MRISDIIAYLGKDRQDAIRAHIIDEKDEIDDPALGGVTPEIINNLEVNIIENSYGKPWIAMDAEHYRGLREVKRANYEMIYKQKSVSGVLDETIRPMLHKMYYKLLDDLKQGRRESPIFTHHIDFIVGNHYAPKMPYRETEPNLMVLDYIASMTDDYFLELFRYLFPHSSLDVRYHGYFD